MIKTYKFSIGVTATQEELDVEQDYKVIELLTDLGIEEGKDLMQLQIKDMLQKLVRNDLLSKLLNVVLTVKDKKPANWNKLKNSELAKVIEDFFYLNPAVSKLLSGFVNLPDITNTNMKLSNSKENVKK